MNTRNVLICVELQMRLRLPAFCFVILSLLLLWYVKPFSCASTIYTWYGMLPAQIAATAAVVLISFIGTPTSSTGTLPILQARQFPDVYCHKLCYNIITLHYHSITIKSHHHYISFHKLHYTTTHTLHCHKIHKIHANCSNHLLPYAL